MAQQDPAFLFYSKDWLTGTAEMMPNEKGVYIDLLAYQHQKGGIPLDTIRIARMVGLSHDEFLPIWDRLKCKFNQRDNQWINQKLTTVMDERASRAKKQRIVAVFASQMKRTNMSKEMRTKIKKKFSSADFVEFPDDMMASEISQWINNQINQRDNQWDNQKDNHYEDGNGNEDGYDFSLEDENFLEDEVTVINNN